MRGPKKKIQRKWDQNNTKSEEYINSKKEKEFLMKYKKIAGEYLEDWELIDIYKKYNFDDEQISKELNKIVLGDEFKWKEIKNGKPVTTRSTDQIRKKKNSYYKPEKSYPSYDKSEEEAYEQNNKRKVKGSYHKSINDFYHYVSKKPKRPFQKCIEVPSDYLPHHNNQEDKKINNSNNNIISNNNSSNNINNNKININNNKDRDISHGKENLKPKNNENFDENNKTNIKNNLTTDKKEINKNEERNINDEEQKKIILLKGQVFKNLKKIKMDTEIKKKESIKSIDRGKENNEDNNNKAPGPEINLNQLRKKYFRDFVGYMKHYPKKMENNIKRANSKDSETSDDRSPETIKRRKRNNIPTSSNIIKKKLIVNNDGINRNLRTTYEIEQNDIEFDSKVINISINSCYDNPYREQYLKYINEKRKQNPGKIVEFIIPQFNNPFMQLYPSPSPYTYNPYMSQNMYMYQMQNAMSNPQMNPQLNQQANQQMNIPLNPQMNYQMNPQMNMQLNQQMRIPINQQMNSHMNSPSNSPINSQNLQTTIPVNQFMNNNNYIGVSDPHLLNNQLNNAPNPEHLINKNNSDN